MDRFIGLDAHTQTCTFAVMGPSGKRLLERVVPTDGQALRAVVESVGGQRHLCMEEGTHSEWLYEVLTPIVDELVVVQSTGGNGRKSDSIDAWALAEQLRRGAIDTKVFKAPGAFTELRASVRAHQVMVRDMVRAKNRLRAVCRARGVAHGEELYDAERRATTLQKLPPAQRHLAEVLAGELDGLMQSHAKAEKWLHEEASRCSQVRRLATAPGIGLTRAAQIVAVVVAPTRFRTSRQFWSYCGLGIVTRSSADWVQGTAGWARRQVLQTRGLTRRRNPMLKSVFKGAAMTVINQLPRHPLHLDYERQLASGIKPNLARVTLARRIAALTLAMWKKQEDYDPAKHRTHAPAA